MNNQNVPNVPKLNNPQDLLSIALMNLEKIEDRVATNEKRLTEIESALQDLSILRSEVEEVSQ